MPNRLGISFEQCVSRFASVPSIRDAAAFCGSLEKLMNLDEPLVLKRDAVESICPPCAEHMEALGLGSLRVGGKDGIPSEIRKRLHRLSDTFHVKLAVSPVKKDASDGTFVAWASVVTEEGGAPIIDHDGDIIPAAELEKAAQDAFRRKGGAGAVGFMHEVAGVADLVESFVFTAEKRRALGLGDGPDGWAVVFRTSNPELLKTIRSGKSPELSIRGNAKRVPVEGAAADIAVLRDLTLSDVELFSVVDMGASGDSRHRPGIVMMKRRPKPPTKKGSKVTQKKTSWLESVSKFLGIKKDAALGMRIAGMAAARDWDASDLAGLTNIDVGVIQQIVDGAVEPSDEQLAAIATALEVTPQDLMEQPAEQVEAQEEGDEEIESQEDPTDETKQEDEEAMKANAAELKKHKDEIAKLRAEVDAHKEATELAECIAKARGLPYLAGTEEELGKALRSLHVLPEAQRDAIVKTLTAANAAVEKSDLFTERGTLRVEASTAMGEIDAIAQTLLESEEDLIKMARGNPVGARAAARTRAARANPDIQKRALKEAN